MPFVKPCLSLWLRVINVATLQWTLEAKGQADHERLDRFHRFRLILELPQQSGGDYTQLEKTLAIGAFWDSGCRVRNPFVHIYAETGTAPGRYCEKYPLQQACYTA